MTFQISHQQILVHQALAALTVNVEITTTKQCVHVYRDTVVRRHHVAQNVCLVRIVPLTKRVAIKNA